MDIFWGTIFQSTTVIIQMVQKRRAGKSLFAPPSFLSFYISVSKLETILLSPQGHLTIITGRQLLLASLR